MVGFHFESVFMFADLTFTHACCRILAVAREFVVVHSLRYDLISSEILFSNEEPTHFLIGEN